MLVHSIFIKNMFSLNYIYNKIKKIAKNKTITKINY